LSPGGASAPPATAPLAPTTSATVIATRLPGVLRQAKMPPQPLPPPPPPPSARLTMAAPPSPPPLMEASPLAPTKGTASSIAASKLRERVLRSMDGPPPPLSTLINAHQVNLMTPHTGCYQALSLQYAAMAMAALSASKPTADDKAETSLAPPSPSSPASQGGGPFLAGFSNSLLVRSILSNASSRASENRAEGDSATHPSASALLTSLLERQPSSLPSFPAFPPLMPLAGGEVAAALSPDRSSSIADLRLKAKRHREALGIAADAD